MLARRTTKAISLGMSLLFVIAVPADPDARTPRVHVFKRKIASGVVHMVIRKKKGPVVIHILKVDLDGRASIRPALGRGMLPGLETTSSMARRRHAVAAVNGDFFFPSGRPLATFARAGELVQTPVMPSANFAIARGDRAAHIGHHRVAVEMKDTRTGRSQGVARVNSGPPGARQLALFTPRGGNLELPPRRACSARLRRVGGYRVRAATGTIAPFRVTKVACRKRRMARLGGIVVSAQRHGTRRTDVTRLRRGQEISLTWRWAWPEIADTLGGNPVLVRNGRIEWQDLSGDHYIFGRHPRTGVGLTASGKILLVTVDGRRRRHSVGMRLRAFAKLFKSLGAEWALNLDGGGSTTMAIRGRVVNRPSDGRERPVGSALLVSVGRRTRSRVVTSSLPSQQEADAPGAPTAAPSLYDPASLGGLASWMQTRGTETPGLARAARVFNAHMRGASGVTCHESTGQTELIATGCTPR